MTHLKQLMRVMVATTALAVGASVAMADGAKIFVVGGKPDDPFWSIVKRGAEDAGKVVQTRAVRSPGSGRRTTTILALTPRS